MAAPRYDDLGQRVTTCCGAYSTYLDNSGPHDEGPNQLLCCKACYAPVPNGEGDGTEFKPGVDPDTYYELTFRRDRWRDAISHSTKESA